MCVYFSAIYYAFEYEVKLGQKFGLFCAQLLLKYKVATIADVGKMFAKYKVLEAGPGKFHETLKKKKESYLFIFLTLVPAPF